jgi:hypothetical protein
MDFQDIKRDHGIGTGIKPQGTAVNTDMLSGKTAINSTGQLITGTMPEKGTLTIASSTASQNFPAGHYTGITANPYTPGKRFVNVTIAAGSTQKPFFNSGGTQINQYSIEYSGHNFNPGRIICVGLNTDWLIIWAVDWFNPEDSGTKIMCMNIPAYVGAAGSTTTFWQGGGSMVVNSSNIVLPSQYNQYNFNVWIYEQ